MASVFLSYSREDQTKARALATALEGLGHSVWWDGRLQGGSRFSHEIEEALKRSDAVLVLWSRASVKSAWVTDEAAEGRDSGRLVPVVIDNCKPPLGFRQYQAIDLSGWKGGTSDSTIEQVHQAIAAKTGASPEEGPSITRSRLSVYRRFSVAATGLAIVVAAALIYWLASQTLQSDAEAYRLRLGSFSAISQDVPQSVPDSLREELLTALGTDSALVVTTNQQSAQLDAGFVLNASVRKVDNLLRFTVNVTNEQTGASLWSETLDRTAAPSIAPRQVAVAVSQVLRCSLGGAGQHGKSMAHGTLSLYFSFCEEYWAGTMGREENPTRALDLARRLTTVAPDFSRAWSGLAQVALWAIRGNQLVDPKTLRAEARRAAERALELDGENSQAYQVLAGLQPPFAYAAREKLHLKSISVRPSECGCEYVGYGEFLGRVGRNSEAVDAFKRAHDMIPLSAGVNIGWAEALFVAGRHDEARQVADGMLKFWPDSSHHRDKLVRTAFWTDGNDEVGAMLSDQRIRVSKREREALINALRALEDGSAAAKVSASKALKKIAEQGSSNGPLIITALAALGADQEALSLAESRIESNGPAALSALFEPSFAGARRTPKFEQIAGRFGLISYWRKSRHLPDFCKHATPPSVCARL